MNATWPARVVRSVPVVLIVVVVGVAVFLGLRSDAASPGTEDAIAIDAVSPMFETVDDMAAASDLVVDATVVGLEEGRIVTDPDHPDRGIRTRLVALRVDSTLSGTAPDVVVVEQEATLLEGTPIVVNGVAPFEEGERAIWFLVGDPTGETDFFAVVNEQGRVAVP